MIFWRSNCKTLGFVLCTLCIHYQLLALGAAFFSHNLVATCKFFADSAEFTWTTENSSIIRISAENKGVGTARESTRALAPAMLKPRGQMHLFGFRNSQQYAKFISFLHCRTAGELTWRSQNASKLLAAGGFATRAQYTYCGFAPDPTRGKSFVGLNTFHISWIIWTGFAWHFQREWPIQIKRHHSPLYILLVTNVLIYEILWSWVLAHINYRVAQKSKPQSFVHTFAKYWPIFKLFHWWVCEKFVVKWLPNIPPHLNCVATLPCEI